MQHPHGRVCIPQGMGRVMMMGNFGIYYQCHALPRADLPRADVLRNLGHLFAARSIAARNPAQSEVRIVIEPKPANL